MISFVVKSTEAFSSALSFINSFHVVYSDNKLCSSSQEGVIPQTRNSNCPIDQSNHVMQIRAFSLSPKEGVELCCSSADQSETSMLIINRRPVSLALNHCLRPELLKDSRNSFFSPLSYSFKLSHNFNMNSSQHTVPPDTSPQPTVNETLSHQTHPPDSQPLLNSTAEPADLVSFVENFPLSSPNFRRQSPRPTMRSRQVRTNLSSGSGAPTQSDSFCCCQDRLKKGGTQSTIRSYEEVLPITTGENSYSC